MSSNKHPSLYALAATCALATSLATSLAGGADIDPALANAAQRIAVGTCANCHGQGGRSELPKVPVLAGQHQTYLVAQLQAFKNKTRGDPDAIGYMWGMAEAIPDDLIEALAAYYEGQHSNAGQHGEDTVLISRGRSLYEGGDPSQGIPPCAACHGPNAAGTDAYPSLAGQHTQYLLKQLRSFQSNMRNVAIMHGVAQTLHPADMEAIAAYLQSAQP